MRHLSGIDKAMVDKWGRQRKDEQAIRNADSAGDSNAMYDMYWED